MFWIVLLMAQAAVPSQTERGEALFFDAQQGCGSCHALKGKGTAVGPDLTGLGRLGPQAIAMAARSTVTQYVQVVKLKAGGSFPAMPGKRYLFPPENPTTSCGKTGPTIRTRS